MPAVSVEKSAEYSPKRLVTDGGRVASIKGRVGGVPTSVPTSIPRTVPTETGVVVFNTIAGVGMFLGQILAARNLATVEGDTIPLRSTLFPGLIIVAAIAIAARLMPSA